MMPTQPPSPPPLPPPLPAFGNGPSPPPPPPLPRILGGGPLASPLQDSTIDRGALRNDITKGIKLRKAVTHDRSAPTVDGNVSGSTSCFLEGKSKTPSSPGAVSPRVKSAGDISGNDPSSGREVPPAAPQLAGIFAGGLPKLRSRGGVDTGASRSSSYISPSNSSATRTLSTNPLVSCISTPRPTIPYTSISSPSVGNLAPPVPGNCPTSNIPLYTTETSLPSSLSASSLVSTRQSLRKTSAPLPRAKSHSPPLKEAPLIPRTKRPPPPPPPPQQPLVRKKNPFMNPALVAALKATGNPTTKYLAGTSQKPPLVPSLRPLPVPSSPSVSNYKDPRSFTLEVVGKRNANGRVVVDDSRWKFKLEEDLPEPRVWSGDRKVYRSGGVGSTVPLDLRLLN